MNALLSACYASFIQTFQSFMQISSASCFLLRSKNVFLEENKEQLQLLKPICLAGSRSNLIVISIHKDQGLIPSLAVFIEVFY